MITDKIIVANKKETHTANRGEITPGNAAFIRIGVKPQREAPSRPYSMPLRIIERPKLGLPSLEDGPPLTDVMIAPADIIIIARAAKMLRFSSRRMMPQTAECMRLVSLTGADLVAPRSFIAAMFNPLPPTNWNNPIIANRKNVKGAIEVMVKISPFRIIKGRINGTPIATLMNMPGVIALPKTALRLIIADMLNITAAARANNIPGEIMIENFGG